jgi:hypothetical protein
MATIAAPPMDTRQLEQVLLAVDPAVCLVAPRILRRVIKIDRRLVGLGLRVPHVKSYVIDRQALRRIATRDELGVAPGRDLPDVVVLLVRPEPDKLAALSGEEALVLYWRLLFHARLHVALEARLGEGRVTSAGVRHRVQRIGPTEFDAIRDVLRQENFLMPPRDDRTAYVEFAALYLELRHFAPSLLLRYFPGLTDAAAIDALLAEDVDAAAVLAQTRPHGAPDPAAVARANGQTPRPHERAADLLAGPPSEGNYRHFVVRADAARAVGNVVRAAILRMQAARVALPGRGRGARNAARAELAVLVDRLQAALGLTDTEARVWRLVLPSLLGPAAQGVWPVEARMLYDLQKVCVDHERELYTADLIEWVRSAFRRPIRRPLPEQRRVLLLKHLRAAARRLRTARIPEADRVQLGDLFLAAVTRKERELRERFRPRVVAVLDQGGLVPQDLPQRVARDKVVEELLDQVVDHGFSTMGDLRDILARSQLKLPDLARPEARRSASSVMGLLAGLWLAVTYLPRLIAEVFRGDRLLRADKQLAVTLDGVCRRGEVYRRFFQRVSSVAFGTIFGRALTRYVALPFGGAYGAIIGVFEIIDVTAKYLLGLDHFHAIDVMSDWVHPWAVRITGLEVDPPPPPGLSPRAAEHYHPLTSMEHMISRGVLTLGLGVFLFALLHVPPFRRAVFKALLWLGRGLHALFLDLPYAVLHWPPLRQVLHSRVFTIFAYTVLKPGIVAGGVLAILWLRRVDPPVAALIAGGVFAGTNLLINSRFGRSLEEIVSDSLERGWQRLTLEIVPQFLSFVLDLFKQLLGAFDRVLYSVDEWLRFRGGETRRSVVAKAIVGLAWFMVAYFARLVVVLFVEPTFNPIKHFPTVTVAAKLLLPFGPAWVEFCSDTLSFLGHWVAEGIGATVFLLLPGLAGFLVWELKENWRLYAANRPPNLRPVMVGSHGETLVRLLRPGFHSGTLPKLHAKLRRAERRALRRAGAADAVRAHRAALHHLGENVRHFFEREFLSLLNASTFWRATPLALGAVKLGANQIRAEVFCPGLDPAPVWLAFEERSGWLLAGVTGPGWLPRLSPEQRGALTTALAGLFKLAGVDLVRQQLQALLPATVAAFDIVDEGLWVGGGPDAEAVYPLDSEADVIVPRVTAGSFPEPLPTLAAVPLLFRRVDVSWVWWVAAWQCDCAGKPHPPLPTPGLRLLPPV